MKYETNNKNNSSVKNESILSLSLKNFKNLFQKSKSQ
jgi:hypothetical protein